MTPLTNITLSIVVPAFNEAEELPRSIGAIHAALDELNIRESTEVIVVDNNSTDGTANVASQLGARVVFEGVNQIARARNAGAGAAKGKYLIFIDADSWVTSAHIKQALEALDAGGVGGGAVVKFEGEVAFSGRIILGIWNRLSRTLRWGAGSFIFARRDAFEAVGGFHEKVYAAEEIFLSRKLKAYGRRQGHKEFRILRDPPLLTSARKVKPGAAGRTLTQALVLLICPWVIYSRRLCWVWYRR